MRLILLLAIVACVALPAPAVAQPRPFPSKPLRILLGYTPGGTAPDTPSIAELGIPGFDFSLWGGFFTPVATPRDIVTRLNREVVQALTQEDLQTRLAREGSEVIRTTPAEFARFVQAESRKYADIIKQINYKPE